MLPCGEDVPLKAPSLPEPVVWRTKPRRNVSRSGRPGGAATVFRSGAVGRGTSVGSLHAAANEIITNATASLCVPRIDDPFLLENVFTLALLCRGRRRKEALVS